MNLVEQVTSSVAAGVNDAASPAQFAPNEVSAMLNWRIAPDGTAEVRFGSRRTHAAALNSGAVGYFVTKRPFITAAGAVQWVAIAGSAAYLSTDEGVTWSAISGATGLREDYWQSATMRVGSTNYLLLVNGGTNGYSWDGTTWATLGGSFPSGVTTIAVHNARVYVAGHNGSIVLGGKIASISDWTGSFTVTVQVQTHDGDNDVIGLFSIGESLLCFKRNSTNYSVGYGQTDLVVAAGSKGISRSVGLLGRRTVQAVGGSGCMWLSDRGIEFYSPAAGLKLASERTQTFFRSIAWGDILASPNLPDAVFVPSRSEYRCALPAFGARNNYEVVYNTITGGTSFFNHATADAGSIYSQDDEPFHEENAENFLVRIVADEPFLTTPAQAGFSVTVTDDEPELAQADADAACLFIADRGGVENDAPGSIGYDGFVRYLDTGETDDRPSTDAAGTAIVARLRPPALVGGSVYQFHEKWLRSIEAQFVAPDATTVTLAAIEGGTEVGAQSVSVAAAIGDRPVIVRARVSAKDPTVEAEVRASKAGLKLSGIALRAEIRRRRF